MVIYLVKESYYRGQKKLKCLTSNNIYLVFVCVFSMQTQALTQLQSTVGCENSSLCGNLSGKMNAQISCLVQVAIREQWCYKSSIHWADLWAVSYQTGQLNIDDTKSPVHFTISNHFCLCVKTFSKQCHCNGDGDSLALIVWTRGLCWLILYLFDVLVMDMMEVLHIDWRINSIDLRSLKK